MKGEQTFVMGCYMNLGAIRSQTTPGILAWAFLLVLTFVPTRAAIGDESEDLPSYTMDEFLVEGRKTKLPTTATKIPVALRLTPASIGVVPQAAVQAQGSGGLGEALQNYIREVKDEVMFQCCFGLDFR